MRLAARNIWLLAGFLLSSTVGLAQPSGQIAFGFGPTNAPVWDFTGPYVLDQPMIGAGESSVPLVYSIFVNHDPNGRLHGSGTTLVTIDTETVAASYSVSGKVRGGGNDTHGEVTVKVNGFDSIAGESRKFSIRATYKVSVDPESFTLTGSVSGKVTMSGLSSSSIRGNSEEVPLPPGVNGSWLLLMDILPLKKLAGTGTVFLSNFVPADTPGGIPGQRVLPMKLSGSYRSDTDLSTVSLTGINEARGTSLKVKFHTGAPAPTYLKGKLLGQKVQHSVVE
jgi:hypothetical protein